MKRILKVYEEINKQMIEEIIDEPIINFQKIIASNDSISNSLVISFDINDKEFFIQFDENLFYKLTHSSTLCQCDIEFYLKVNKIVQDLDKIDKGPIELQAEELYKEIDEFNQEYQMLDVKYLFNTGDY